MIEATGSKIHAASAAVILLLVAGCAGTPGSSLIPSAPPAQTVRAASPEVHADGATALPIGARAIPVGARAIPVGARAIPVNGANNPPTARSAACRSSAARRAVRFAASISFRRSAS